MYGPSVNDLIAFLWGCVLLAFVVGLLLGMHLSAAFCWAILGACVAGFIALVAILAYS